MKRLALAALLVLSACAGNVSVPNTTMAVMLKSQESLSKRQDSLMQDHATLQGKMDLLIQLKREEVKGLHDANENLDQTRRLLERVLEIRGEDDAGGSLQRR